MRNDINKIISLLEDYNSPYEEIYKWSKSIPNIEYVEDFQKTYLNLNDSYIDNIELVSVKDLIKMREFDRNVISKWGDNSSKEKIEELKHILIKEGIKSAMIIDYSVVDKKVLLIEGNHRLNAAIELGLEYYPARVVKRNGKISGNEKDKAFSVKGITPDKYGYVPSTMKPSQIGIDTKPLDDEYLYT